MLLMTRLCQCVFNILTPKKDIQNVCLKFFDVERIIVATVGKEIFNSLELTKHSRKDYILQCYEGASNVESDKKALALHLTML